MNIISDKHTSHFIWVTLCKRNTAVFYELLWIIYIESEWLFGIIVLGGGSSWLVSMIQAILLIWDRNEICLLAELK